MAVNIGKANEGDAFYRYKMPALQSKIEGRGNGIKTNVMNMVDVAKALGRPASYTTKYFGTELGAQTKFEEGSGLAIVNGAHETGRLTQLLEGFIKRFVQCGQCNNPETDIVLTKKETIELVCKACGAVTQVDMRHKLCTFILKNPPEVKDKAKKLRRAEKERIKEGEALDKAEKDAKKKAKGDKGDKAEKKSKSSKSKSKKESAEAEEGGSGGGDSAKDDSEEDAEEEEEVQWSTDTSAAAAAARAAEQLTDGAASMVTATKAGGGAGGETPPPSPTAAMAAMALSAGGAGESESDEEDEGEGEDEEDEEDPMVRKLRAYAAAHSAAQTAAKLRGFKTENLEHRMHVLVSATLDASPLPKQLAKAAPLYALCAPDPASRAALLASIELALSTQGEAHEGGTAGAAKGLAAGLKALYDADSLDEASIVTWFDTPGAAKKFGVAPEDAAAVRKAAAVFVEWLKNAESGSDSD